MKQMITAAFSTPLRHTLDARVGLRARMKPPRAPNDVVRKLAYFETASPDQLVPSWPLPLVGTIGDVHTFDMASRVHYTLLLGKADMKPYLASDYCATMGKPCAEGTSCCCDSAAPPDVTSAALARTLGADPPAECANPYAICYSVTDCSQIPPDASFIDVPAYIVGIQLDDGTVTTQTPICSLMPSNHTVPVACPWSIEVAA